MNERITQKKPNGDIYTCGENIKKAYPKLSRLEDLEDELGIGFEVLLEAFANGIYVKIGKNKIEYIRYIGIFKKRKWHLYSSDTFWGKYLIALTNEYGKKWALTERELKHGKKSL